MSTICASAYTNTFMTDFESKYIYPYNKRQNKYVLKVYWWPFHDMDRFKIRIARIHEWFEQETSFDQIGIQVLTNNYWTPGCCIRQRSK